MIDIALVRYAGRELNRVFRTMRTREGAEERKERGRQGGAVVEGG